MYESNINWEEESNDERNIYCLNEGMALSPKSENEIPALNSMNRHVIESFEEELSTQYEDKEIIYNNELASSVDECHEATCSCNQQYISDFKINASTPIDKIRDDWWSIITDHLRQENSSNIDLYSTCFIDDVDDVSSCIDDSRFSSSHVKSFHDSDIRNSFMIFANPFYGEELYVDQNITSYNVYKGGLHGIISSLFKGQMECLDFLNVDLDDTLSYYCKKSNCSSSRCDNDFNDDVASYDVDSEVLDEFFIEDHPTPCKEFYDEVSNRMANMFADCKESLEDSDSRLVSDIDIDDMCEYKSDFSFVYHLVIHENTQFQGMCDLFSQVEYESFIFKVYNMHNSPNEEGY